MGSFKDIWNPAKDGERKEQRSFLRYFIVSSVIFFILVGFVNKNNLVRWARSEVKIHTQQHRIEQLEKEIGEMDKQIRSLKGNRDSLEQFARERFQFAEKGDDVYLTEP